VKPGAAMRAMHAPPLVRSSATLSYAGAFVGA